MTKPTRTENSIEQAFLRWCKSQGLRCEKLASTNKGWPDRCVLLPGNKVVWIEFKTPRGVLSPQQEFTHRKMRQAGHVVHVCRSVDEAKAAVLGESVKP